MLGDPRRLHWRINRLMPDLKIGNLINKEFASLAAVKAWLNTEEEVLV